MALEAEGTLSLKEFENELVTLSCRALQGGLHISVCPFGRRSGAFSPNPKP